MLRLAILADDLTGALDTGVQFAALGCRTAVTVGTELSPDCTAAVCDLETRRLTPDEAYARTAKAAEAALEAGARYIYVKTDSGLRGNVGAALAALSAAGKPVLFAPAYPENRRVTRGGIHYIDGVPVSRSLFGRDPLTPVRHDKVADILRETGSADFREIGGAVPDSPAGVMLADAETDGDLFRLAGEALDRNVVRFAGCAGLARQLAARLDLSGETEIPMPRADSLLILCGSVSPVSLAQLEKVRETAPCFLLREAAADPSPVRAALDRGTAVVASAFTAADIRENDAAGCTAASVAAAMGHLARQLTERAACGLFVTGGETLLAVMEALGNGSLLPLREAESGVVLCRLQRGDEARLLITKSGSFGSPDVMRRACERYGRR